MSGSRKSWKGIWNLTTSFAESSSNCLITFDVLLRQKVQRTDQIRSNKIYPIYYYKTYEYQNYQYNLIKPNRVYQLGFCDWMTHTSILKNWFFSFFRLFMSLTGPVLVQSATVLSELWAEDHSWVRAIEQSTAGTDGTCICVQIFFTIEPRKTFSLKSS